jgi:4-coumarate--CoA ligase
VTNTLFIIDRKKEVMKYKGYHVNPSEIENVIEKIDGVEIVSVVGIPDDIATNLSAAVIQKRPGYNNLTEKFIVDFVADNMAVQKHLHGGVFFVDDFPKTASGKIQKRFVKDIVINRMNKNNSSEF